MQFERFLDQLHGRAFRTWWLHPFASFCRLTLAAGFIAPGLTKVLGYRFANPEVITTDTPIGAFFDVFFAAGAYYQFVGAAQILAAILLLSPRTAALGAVIYFPIILNIFVITAAMNFEGTVVVSGLMLLACTYLLLWHYPLWKGLLFARLDASGRVEGVQLPTGPAARAAWWFAAAGSIGIGIVSRGIFRYPIVVFGSLALLAAAFLLGLWAAAVWAKQAYVGRGLTPLAGDAGPE